MLIEEFKIEVNRKPGYDLWEVYLGRYDGKDLYVYNADKGGNLIATRVDEGKDNVKPLLKVPSMLWRQLVLAISKDLPNIQKDVVDSELKATKYHLEDMRKLVLKNKY